jgi:hypothetical protein
MLTEVARRVNDPAIGQGLLAEILVWPIKTLMTYHDLLTHAITDGPHAALEKAARESKQI